MLGSAGSAGSAAIAGIAGGAGGAGGAGDAGGAGGAGMCRNCWAHTMLARADGDEKCAFCRYGKKEHLEATRILVN